MDLSQGPSSAVEVSIIVPSRNEEACLGLCLESLTTQVAIQFEIIVVDDGSTDRTREIAQSFSGVRVVDAGSLPANWTGKNHAMVVGAAVARGEWLLFTDADAVHSSGSLERAVAEARRQGASLLSYSPRQEVHGFWEKAVMPVIFAELAAAYRPQAVNDPASPIGAANGQYLLISREAYDAVGGHRAIAADLLEDVAMARLVKSSGRKIFFRYGGDAVRTRMYRSFAQMKEGWTKNLALLFPSAIRLSMVRFAEFLAITGCLCVGLVEFTQGERSLSLLALVGGIIFYVKFRMRIRKAHSSWTANLLSIFGLPIFAYLLLRSRLFHKHGKVSWKGRTYGAPLTNSGSDHQSISMLSRGVETN